MLGAIDSLPLGVTERPEEEEGGRRRAGSLGGAALLRLRPRLDLRRVRALLPRPPPVRGVLLRGPAYLLARRRPREPFPAAGASGSAAAAARVRSVSVCPGSTSFVRASTRTRLARSSSIAIPSSARISRGVSSEPPASRGTPLRLLLGWLAPSVAAAQSAPPASQTARPRASRGVEPVAGGRRCVRDRAWRLSDLRGGLSLSSLGECARQCRVSRQRPHGRRRRAVLDAGGYRGGHGFARRISTPWPSSGRGHRRASSSRAARAWPSSATGWT